MTSSSPYRTLFALWALVLLAVPTVVFCLECVGLCSESSMTVAVHAHESPEVREAKTRHHAVQMAQPAAAMPSGHCESVTSTAAAHEVVAEAAPEAEVTNVPAPAITADCCLEPMSAGSDSPATRSAGSDFGADPLLGSFVVASSPVVATGRFADRFDVPIQQPPLFRLHAALLL